MHVLSHNRFIFLAEFKYSGFRSENFSWKWIFRKDAQLSRFICQERQCPAKQSLRLRRKKNPGAVGPLTRVECESQSVVVHNEMGTGQLLSHKTRLQPIFWKPEGRDVIHEKEVSVERIEKNREDDGRELPLGSGGSISSSAKAEK